MNSFQRNAVALIKNALNFEKTKLEEPINWEEIVALAKSHHISSLIYCAIKNTKESVPKEFLKWLETTAIGYAVVEEQQLYELARIEDAFNREGISYMLLKGINIRRIYPNNVTRCMKDLDILIKTEQYDTIKPLMQKLGFKEDKETYHELVWKKGRVIVELHKSIESPYNKDFYAYFGDGWNFAVKDEFVPCRYIMKKEDEFSYLFTHFAGHYRLSGIGIMHFVDLWIYLQNNPSIDEDYLNEALSKIGLIGFYKNVLKTLNVWFASGEEDEVTEFITNKIFSKGSLGEVPLEIISSAARQAQLNKNGKNSKLKTMVRILFPSYNNMRLRQPFLKKAPFLLPAAWILRWFDILLFKNAKISQKRAEIRLQTQENITEYLDELKTVGLDFKE